MKRRHGEIVHSSVWTPNNKKEVNDMFEKGFSGECRIGDTGL